MKKKAYTNVILLKRVTLVATCKRKCGKNIFTSKGEATLTLSCVGLT